MSYRYSNIDRKNLKWFGADNSVATLSSMALTTGQLRGLRPFRMKLKYPISAIAGINGSGKSTVLAMAACAYHNESSDFEPPLSRRSYYTFGDFFVQSSHDISVEGIVIRYGIRYDDWYRLGPGVGYQARRKRKGGKWNNYRDRVDRNVLYFGIHRIVPHYERSVYKSNRSRFVPGNLSEETRNDIANTASRIFGRDYTDYNQYRHFKYTLPQVEIDNFRYSGFNMGAGEISVFDILTSIVESGRGTLVVIDEIELGLHETAQQRFIEELKLLCTKLHCQIICSTHSYAVLSNLPPEACFFLEGDGTRTQVTRGISANYACGKMGKEGAHELDVFVEDDIAKDVLRMLLSAETRRRIRIIPIGSVNAVLRQMAGRYLELSACCLCILDGDQSGRKRRLIQKVAEYVEASNDEEKEDLHRWVTGRMLFFPGRSWPEKWLLDSVIGEIQSGGGGGIGNIVDVWGLSSEQELLEICKQANLAHKHYEFFEMSNLVGLDVQCIRTDIIRVVVRSNRNSLDTIVGAIDDALP